MAKKLVFEPLGMKRSHYRVIQDPDSKRYAAGHTVQGKLIPGKRHLYPESAAASLWTTPSEYAQFGLLLLNRGKAGKQQVLIKVADRVIMSYPTAKRLANSLGQLVKRYEQQFGEVPMGPGGRK